VRRKNVARDRAGGRSRRREGEEAVCTLPLTRDRSHDRGVLSLAR
jgi:hypothetical protein